MLIFYDHLIDKSETIYLIESFDIPPEKKSHLKAIIDDILHTGIMEMILQKLKPHHHKTFLLQLEKSPYDPELLHYLKNHLEGDVEELIKTESQRLLKLIHKDLL